MPPILRIPRVRCALAPGCVPARLLALLCLASACGAERDAAAEPQLPPSSEPELKSSVELELGSGEAAFEPARAGDHLRLYAGTQGGHHVWLSLRVRGFQSDEIRMVLDVIPAEPAPPARTDVRLHFAQVAGGSDGEREFIGFPARVLEPACAAGQAVRLAVQLEDGQGQMVRDELEVVADPPILGFTSECSL